MKNDPKHRQNYKQSFLNNPYESSLIYEYHHFHSNATLVEYQQHLQLFGVFASLSTIHRFFVSQNITLKVA